MKIFKTKYLITSIAIHIVVACFLFKEYSSQKSDTSLLITEIISVKNTTKSQNIKKEEKFKSDLNKVVKTEKPKKQIEDKTSKENIMEPKDILLKPNLSKQTNISNTEFALPRLIENSESMENYQSKNIKNHLKSIKTNKEITKAIYKIGSIKNPHPPYPIIARKRGLQGRLVLEVFVNIDGSVGNVNISKSSGHLILDKISKETIQKWTFVPATNMGKPVRDNIRVPIRFVLTD